MQLSVYADKWGRRSPSEPETRNCPYKRAIDQDDSTDAMFHLADLYLGGTGASNDAIRATQLLQRAIDKDGRADALICLGWCANARGHWSAQGPSTRR